MTHRAAAQIGLEGISLSADPDVLATGKVIASSEYLQSAKWVPPS